MQQSLEHVGWCHLAAFHHQLHPVERLDVAPGGCWRSVAPMAALASIPLRFAVPMTERIAANKPAPQFEWNPPATLR
jgi:hypothetical protein